MKKQTLIFILFLGFITSAFTQVQKSLTITQTNSPYIVENETDSVALFIMEDNTVIKFAKEISSWTLISDSSKIGNNCKIIGVGTNGVNGNERAELQGRNARDVIDDCKRGGNASIRNGYKASNKNGKNGTDGIDIIITTKFVKFGSLSINVSGGKGGDGVNGKSGGKGGKADVSDKCIGGRGGKGGNGGDGGRGGNGGNVTFNLDKNGFIPLINHNLTIEQIGGNSGDEGKKGKPGLGGERVCRSVGPFTSCEEKGSDGLESSNGRKLGRGYNGDYIQYTYEGKDCLEDINEESCAILIVVDSVGKTEFTEQANLLKNILKEQYEFDGIETFYNKTREELTDFLEGLASERQCQNMFIFISGHGSMGSGGVSFLSYDEKLMPFRKIYSDIERVKSEEVSKILLMIDVCHGGEIFAEVRGLSTEMPNHPLRIPEESCGLDAFTIITSGYQDETVPKKDFGKQLHHVLKTNPDGVLTSEQLFYRLYEDNFFERQTPIFGQHKSYENGDFIFFKKQ